MNKDRKSIITTSVMVSKQPALCGSGSSMHAIAESDVDLAVT